MKHIQRQASVDEPLHSAISIVQNNLVAPVTTRPIQHSCGQQAAWISVNFINHFFSETLSRTGMFGNLLLVSSAFGAKFKSPLFLSMLAKGCTRTDDPNLLHDPFWATLFAGMMTSTAMSLFLVAGKKQHIHEWTCPTSPLKKSLYICIAAVQEALEAFGFVGLSILTRISSPAYGLLTWLLTLPVMSWPVLSEYLLRDRWAQYGVPFERGPLQNYFSLPIRRRLIAFFCELVFTIMAIAATADSLWTAVNIIRMDYGVHASEEAEMMYSNIALGLSTGIGFLACLCNEMIWRWFNVLLIGMLSDAAYPLLFYMSMQDCLSNAMHDSYVAVASLLGLVSIIGYIPPRVKMLSHHHSSDRIVVLDVVGRACKTAWQSSVLFFQEQCRKRFARLGQSSDLTEVLCESDPHKAISKQPEASPEPMNIWRRYLMRPRVILALRH